MAVDNQYTYPAGTHVYTTGSIGDVNPSEQLPVSSNGLHEYPVATKTWSTTVNAPAKSEPRFTRNIVTTELPGADSVGENSNSASWTNAKSSISYTWQNNGEGI